MKRVLILGTNDVATASAIRLFRSGFAVTLIANEISNDLFYFRNFSPVISLGSKIIQNIKAQCYSDLMFHAENDSRLSLRQFIIFALQHIYDILFPSAGI